MASLVGAMENSPGNNRVQSEIDGDLRKSHGEIVALAQSVNAIQIRTFEELETEEIRAQLGPLATRYLQESLSHTRHIFSLCDQWEQKTNPGRLSGDEDEYSREFDFEIDKLVFSPQSPQDDPNSREHVADIAFIAKSELKDRLQRFASLTDEEDAWQLLAEYDSALRCICKSLAAVEYVLCEAESLPRQLDFRTELEVSLMVRKAYLKFQSSLAGSETPTEKTVYSRLRVAGTQIAVLVGRDVYPSLRIRDRAELRSMQSRILDWMRNNRSDERAGLRIWQDLTGVVDMFCQVSRRQELVDHDTETVERIHQALEANPDQELSDELISLAESIQGLDRELDQLVSDDRRGTPELWYPAIKRLMVHFGKIQPESSAVFDLLDDSDFF